MNQLHLHDDDGDDRNDSATATEPVAAENTAAKPAKGAAAKEEESDTQQEQQPSIVLQSIRNLAFALRSIDQIKISKTANVDDGRNSSSSRTDASVATQRQQGQGQLTPREGISH